MMKPIKSLGSAVVAVAAPALSTRPAAADIRSVARVETLLGSDTKLTLSIGSGYDDCHRGGGYRRGLNRYGQTDREVRERSRDVEIDDDLYVLQIGRRGFFVTPGRSNSKAAAGMRKLASGAKSAAAASLASGGIPCP
jgi:hypothetical protein